MRENYVRWTPEIADKIIERIAGGESVVQICQDKDMPGRRAVYVHVGQDDEFRRRYEAAMETRAESYADEIVHIADGEPRIVGITEDGCPILENETCNTTEDIARDRLRVDARKWAAAQYAPKKYGKQNLTVSSPDGGPAFVIQVPPVEDDADEWAKQHKPTE